MSEVVDQAPIAKQWRRVVVKVGTSSIVDAAGEIKYPVINRLAQTLTQLE